MKTPFQLVERNFQRFQMGAGQSPTPHAPLIQLTTWGICLRGGWWCGRGAGVALEESPSFLRHGYLFRVSKNPKSESKPVQLRWLGCDSLRCLDHLMNLP
ncbi:unnamed protein product [Victoria cruziana]